MDRLLHDRRSAAAASECGQCHFASCTHRLVSAAGIVTRCYELSYVELNRCEPATVETAGWTTIQAQDAAAAFGRYIASELPSIPDPPQKKTNLLLK